ncbi:hypothetical protein [Streptomyces cadmiisoli]|uniref:hypothetical protein n=1 Tax=Streptomyces cadmiisoli TaxID=2184053 RepID=UPI003652845D
MALFKKTPAGVNEVQFRGETRYEAINDPSATVFKTAEEAASRHQAVKNRSDAIGRTKRAGR